MKKVLFFFAACAMALVACNNADSQATNANSDTDSTATEVTVNKQPDAQPAATMSAAEVVAKAKAEGANWTVDQWKDAFRNILIAAKPMFLYIKDMQEKIEKGDEADKMKFLEEMEAREAEFKPIEKAITEFDEIARASVNGKKVIDDEAWGKQVMSELGIPQDIH